MTIKPKVDYFIVEGKMICRGDDGFADLEAKYVKEFIIDETNNEGKDGKANE